MGDVEIDSISQTGWGIAALTSVTDEFRAMLRDGLATMRRSTLRARTNDVSDISAPPFTL